MEYALIQKTLQWIKLFTKENRNALTYHQDMEVCVINFSTGLAFGTTSAMGHKNPRSEESGWTTRHFSVYTAGMVNYIR